MVHATRLVFSDARFVILAAGIFAAMSTTMAILSEYVFLEPYVVGHVPSGSEPGLALIMALSALSALVIPMNVFRISALRRSKGKMGGGILGAAAGAAAGACGCGPAGFAIISTFGSAGATATAFLTHYEIPIRIAAVAVLAVTYVTTVRSIRTECGIGS